MQGLLFMAATFVIEGSLVLLLMHLFVRGQQEAAERAPGSHRLAPSGEPEVRRAA
jgi:hypothetical protein